MVIKGTSTYAPAPAADAAPAGKAPQGFSDALKQLISTVDQTTADANAATSRMLDGTGDVHEAMIALQHADMTFQLTMQIRNKLVQAYQDVMRMPV